MLFEEGLWLEGGWGLREDFLGKGLEPALRSLSI